MTPQQSYSLEPQQEDPSLGDADQPCSAHRLTANDAASAPQLEICVDAVSNSPTLLTADSERRKDYRKKQNWLLLLRHVSKCIAPQGQCRKGTDCHSFRTLWWHIVKCTDHECQVHRCKPLRDLIKHNEECHNTQCPVCITVEHKKIQLHLQADTLHQLVARWANINTTVQVGVQQDPSAGTAKNAENLIAPPQPQSVAPMMQDHSTSVGNIEGCGGGNATVNSEMVDLSLTNANIQNEVGATVSPCTKTRKSKIKGVSLVEFFSLEQIEGHIVSLQRKGTTEMEFQASEQPCQLCGFGQGQLTWQPAPIYCTPCGTQIKRNAYYWTMRFAETRYYLCIPCYRANTVKEKWVYLRNSTLEETDEPWVECDQCKGWQHQVCALFNSRRNKGGQAEYVCPFCLKVEIENGIRIPLPQSAIFGAKDLPKEPLSDHIEQRLSRRLTEERNERARLQGKSSDEVPGVDPLVIRVVLSADKKLEVKQRFLEIFREDNYPIQFPYKSKVLLLFQKIEGVEVCLFGMYVQEYSAESAQPNQRRVYLSYLDSVKYFTPDIRTTSGETLRTFVYHEILVGYLDYCKIRGFTSCFIWACPPLEGDDYILYCHPESQTTLKSDKLRKWYQRMLDKAIDEKIVVEVTTLYDHFFVQTAEAKANITAARLPYFDGDYWPGKAEEILRSQGGRNSKTEKNKNATNKRTTKTAARTGLMSLMSKDLQLMEKLREFIYPTKDNFIMVHLQHSCTHCSNFILSGIRWVCQQCKDFQICEGCHDLEQNLDEQDRHPLTSKEAHSLFPAETLAHTEAKDGILESEIFDTREAFLSLCQGNHYQYDTLRRAKHSSMMVLYHLHDPTAPAFLRTCNLCKLDIEEGQGWHCKTCPDFDMCKSCYSSADLPKHPHKLSPAAEDNGQVEASTQKIIQSHNILVLLVHTSQCTSAQCKYPKCHRLKEAFRHHVLCKNFTDCKLCKQIQYWIRKHVQVCKDSDCQVPFCKYIKACARQNQQQMESRRRSLMEMVREYPAETTAGLE